MAFERIGPAFIWRGYMKQEAEEFIKEQLEKPLVPSQTTGGYNSGVNDARTSEQCMINPTNPYCLKVKQAVAQLNEEMWNINIFEHCSENNFIRYNAGGKFKMHHDIIYPTNYANHVSRPVRKISAIVLLSDRGSFEGGKFALTIDEQRGSFDFDQGDLLVFPSYIRHQVDELTSGIRYSTVHWSYGGF
jgi:predicted 2-oxoglutarate/Fe(II)-dependent dioxygenase YbiX